MSSLRNLHLAESPFIPATDHGRAAPPALGFHGLNRKRATPKPLCPARTARSRAARWLTLIRVRATKPSGRPNLMSYNTFGHLFRVTTFGESHGVAIGCVVDGCPPLLPLAVEDIQRDLDRRRPGQSRFTTQRQEADAVKILSGVMAHPETGAQVTTGTPIALLIENTDQRSKDYSDIKDK